MTAPSQEPPGLLTGQALHAGALTLLLGLALGLHHLLGSAHPLAFGAALAAPVLHQVYVWLAWRLELRSGVTGRVLGFRLYMAIFFGLFFARFAALAWLAFVDRGSLALSPGPRVVLTLVLGLPALYAGYSVARYFGMVRAAGADHFEARFRSMPLVKKGIFRFTSNGMYLYAFLGFWAIATGADSTLSLIAAGFAHAYIWVHYLATERPDMRFLYRAVSKENPPDAAAF